MTVENLKIVDMISVPDDVVININESETSGGLLQIWEEIKGEAITIANCEETRYGNKVIVDMGRTTEGYPIADLYRNGNLFRKIFATMDTDKGNHERLDHDGI